MNKIPIFWSGFFFAMIKLFSVLAISFVLFSCSNTKEITKTPEYDEALAKSLGADEYGMKLYVMAFLKSGPNRTQDSITTAEIQKGHMANIQRMANEGKLVVAGPFMDEGEIRGIYLFNVATIEEAQALTNTDPAIVAGRLIMELHPWYGSAALLQVNQNHKKIAKLSF